MIGESPQRPGSFQASPLVVVVPEISPFSLNAEQWMVPVGGKSILRIAIMRCLGAIPRSAATSFMCSIFAGSTCCRKSLLCDADGTFFFQFGSGNPGPHQSE